MIVIESPGRSELLKCIKSPVYILIKEEEKWKHIA